MVAASCGYKEAGRSGLSAGMMIAAKQGIIAMVSEVDHEEIAGGTRSAPILKGDVEVACMAAHGHVGMEQQRSEL